MASFTYPSTTSATLTPTSRGDSRLWDDLNCEWDQPNTGWDSLRSVYSDPNQNSATLTLTPKL